LNRSPLREHEFALLCQKVELLLREQSQGDSHLREASHSTLLLRASGAVHDLFSAEEGMAKRELGQHAVGWIH
jgi:hypothetical protein